MKKMMKCIKKNEGFTLVELMIVLSIIAILAVILVPKVGDMKDSVRNQGVEANVNSVRAFLELQINDRIAEETLEGDRLLALLQNHFTDGNVISNPFTNGTDVDDWSEVGDLDHSVILYEYNNGSIANTLANNNLTGTYAARRGQTIIWVCTNGYVVWGHGSDGDAVAYYTIK